MSDDKVQTPPIPQEKGLTPDGVAESQKMPFGHQIYKIINRNDVSFIFNLLIIGASAATTFVALPLFLVAFLLTLIIIFISKNNRARNFLIYIILFFIVFLSKYFYNKVFPTQQTADNVQYLAPGATIVTSGEPEIITRPRYSATADFLITYAKVAPNDITDINIDNIGVLHFDGIDRYGNISTTLESNVLLDNREFYNRYMHISKRRVAKGTSYDFNQGARSENVIKIDQRLFIVKLHQVDILNSPDRHFRLKYTFLISEK